MAPHSLRTDVSSSTKASSLKTPTLPLKKKQLSKFFAKCSCHKFTRNSAIKLTVQRRHVVHLVPGHPIKRTGVLGGNFEKKPGLRGTKILFSGHGLKFYPPVRVGKLKIIKIKMFLIAYTVLNHCENYNF